MLIFSNFLHFQKCRKNAENRHLSLNAIAIEEVIDVAKMPSFEENIDAERKVNNNEGT